LAVKDDLLEGYPKLKAILLGIQKEVPIAARNAINTGAAKIHKMAVTEIVSGYSPMIKDTGALQRSLGFGQGASKKAGPVTNAGPVFAEVGSNLPYASAIEYGSGPHWVSLQPLFRWAKRKITKDKNKAYLIAKAIQRRIARQGTKGRPFLFPAYEEVRKELPGMIKKEIRKQIRKRK